MFNIVKACFQAQEYINQLANPSTTESNVKEDGEVKDIDDTPEILPEIDMHTRFPWLAEGYKQLLEDCPVINQMDFMPACKRCCISTNSVIPSEQNSVIHNREGGVNKDLCKTSIYTPSKSELEHSCTADLLLARYRGNQSPTWRLIRILPHQERDARSYFF